MATIKKVSAGSEYFYNPVGLDLWDARTTLSKGDKVKVVNLPGCPKANTMGHCHVTKEGKFAGLVLTNSLVEKI